jgi:hypothetical protein
MLIPICSLHLPYETREMNSSQDFLTSVEEHMKKITHPNFFLDFQHQTKKQ